MTRPRTFGIQEMVATPSGAQSPHSLEAVFVKGGGGIVGGAKAIVEVGIEDGGGVRVKNGVWVGILVDVGVGVGVRVGVGVGVSVGDGVIELQSPVDSLHVPFPQFVQVIESAEDVPHALISKRPESLISLQ